MGLFEWFMERYNPGPTGYTEINQTNFENNSFKKWQFFLLIVIGMLAWTGLLYLLFFPQPTTDLVYKLLFLTIYFVASWFIQVKPRTDNLGWAGGLIDNPFRFSDDINRFLVFLQVFFLPGKLMVGTIILFIKWVR